MSTANVLVLTSNGSGTNVHLVPSISTSTAVPTGARTPPQVRQSNNVLQVRSLANA